MPTNPKDYVTLRTMLDSLEVGALRYFLSGEGLSQPRKIEKLKGMLQPVIDELWHPLQAAKNSAVETDCPPGYFDCDGCCVPYKCPDLSGLQPKPRPKSAKRKR